MFTNDFLYMNDHFELDLFSHLTFANLNYVLLVMLCWKGASHMLWLIVKDLVIHHETPTTFIYVIYV